MGTTHRPISITIWLKWFGGFFFSRYFGRKVILYLSINKWTDQVMAKDKDSPSSYLIIYIK
jgi:hypothetical protein